MKKSTFNDTAILIFAKSAKAEAKRLISDREDNHNLISLLNPHVERVAKKTGLPYFVIDECKQVGNSFGERLTHAFQQIFALGFDHVLAVGNDCPSLKPADLGNANMIIQSGRSVLGPDKRGGIYLLGLSQKSFNPKSLQNIRWQGVHTFSELNRTLDQAYLLSTRCDLNNTRDFQTFLRQSNNSELRVLFHQVLKNKIQFIKKPITQNLSNINPAELVLRGPPIATIR